MSVWELTNLSARLLLPPGGLVLLALLGLVLIRAAPRAGQLLAVAALAALYAISTPLVGGALLRSIESPYRDPASDPSGEAIIVLGGGSYVGALEYGRDTVGWITLERLRYAAYLHHKLGKPILIAGGRPRGTGSSEAEQMRHALRELGASARWMEDRSTNTLENARYGTRILRAAGIQRAYLVTHSWHLPRAALVFEHEGLEVIPAGTRYKLRGVSGPVDFVPSANALLDSWHYFHEVAGVAWYRLRLRLDGAQNARDADQRRPPA
jgi:uncharacterized SAM-binding protein YcdF (DUF218 family)